MIRFFDILFSSIGIFMLSPLLLVISFIIKITSKGPILYKQKRVGYLGADFIVWKFRTMKVDSDKIGLLTVGGRDSRITKIGYYLRKFKLDELPQLFNVLFGTMSLVGPRPEVLKYVNLYTIEQRKVLSVKPGITDYASIEYVDENEILGLVSDPDKMYIEEILPAKIQLNIKYIENKGLKEYFKIIFLTFYKIVSNKTNK